MWVVAAGVYITIHAVDIARSYLYTPPSSGLALPWKLGVSPGPDWTWKGRTNNPKDGDGNWVRGERPRLERLNPDFDHPEPIGPHWNYTDQDGEKYRIYPDGTIEPK